MSHTCHISHCEIQSHRILPIWKAIPLKNSNLQNFQTILQQILWRNKHISHTVVVFTSFLHEKKKKTLDYIRGAPKWCLRKSHSLVKYPLKVCLISQILVHSLWHVWWVLIRTILPRNFKWYPQQLCRNKKNYPRIIIKYSWTSSLMWPWDCVQFCSVAVNSAVDLTHYVGRQYFLDTPIWTLWRATLYFGLMLIAKEKISLHICAVCCLLT